MRGKTPKPQKHSKGCSAQSFPTKARSALSEMPFSAVPVAGLRVAWLRALPGRGAVAGNSSRNLLTQQPSQPAPGHQHPVQGSTKTFDSLFLNVTEIKM